MTNVFRRLGTVLVIWGGVVPLAALPHADFLFIQNDFLKLFLDGGIRLTGDWVPVRHVVSAGLLTVGLGLTLLALTPRR